MSNKESIIEAIAGRYARALFELAQESGEAAFAQTRADIKSVATLLAESDAFTQLIRSPIIAQADQHRAIQAVLSEANISELTRHFIGVLTRNRRSFCLPAIIRAFTRLEQKARGEISAEVTTAHALTDAQIQALKAQMKQAIGQDIELQTAIDPSILGGLVVKLGSRMVDGSLRYKLNSLKQAMNEAS